MLKVFLYSEECMEHVSLLKYAFKTLDDTNHVVNIKKTELTKTYVQYLGYQTKHGNRFGL